MPVDVLGDGALIAFAEPARAQLRPGDLIARYEGGEEFCGLLRDANEPDARRIAERLRASIAKLSIDVDGRPLRITASIGLARLDGSWRQRCARPMSRSTGPRPSAAIRSAARQTYPARSPDRAT